MLFNSFPFLLGFLPVVLVGVLLLAHAGQRRLVLAFLVCASLFFYAYWNPAYLWVIVASVLVNFGFGITLGNSRNPLRGRVLLALGIAFNLGLLGYFKYLGFFSRLFIVDEATTFGTFITDTALPIGISFYTFQQLAFLVDSYRSRGQVRYDFLEYAFFVTFFPQLIAGPIVHHKEIIPQLSRAFARLVNGRYVACCLAPGLALLIIGLGKKVLLADTFGYMADLSFDAAAEGAKITFIEAWGGSLAYALQIYFDFSAYSDMAIGLGQMFGLKLPVNFFSPYKATSIIDFWRRWHMTLSRFLRDYLYIPLGGNRKGPARRYVNLIATMLLGGLWHGASLTFVAWGAIHGGLLALNHAWRHLVKWRPPVWLAVPVTLTLVVMAWVPFRAADFGVVLNFYHAMAGFDGIAVPIRYGAVVEALGPLAAALNVRVGEVVFFDGMRQLLYLCAGLFIVLACPNAMALLEPVRRLRFMRSRLAASWTGMVLAGALLAMYFRDNVTFLYFQF